MGKRARFAFRQEVKMVTVISINGCMATVIDDNGYEFHSLTRFLKFKKEKKVDFKQYFYTFYSWSDLDWDKNKRKIRNINGEYWQNYLEYCSEINSEPFIR